MPIIEQAIVGQTKLVEFFDKLAILSTTEALNGSFILVGPESSGKKTLATVLAAKLLCQGKAERPCGECQSCREIKNKINSDLYWLSKQEDKKNISVEEVRGLIHSLSLSALTYDYKVAIIDHAETLSTGASNALLKTLEEPNKKTIVIMLVNNLDKLPKTIVSRSQVFNLRPIKPDLVYDWLVNEHGTKRSEAKALSRLSLGWPGLAIKFSADEALEKNHLATAEIFLNASNLGIPDRLEAIEKLLKNYDNAEDILIIWQSATRDCLLTLLNQTDWLRYGSLAKDSAIDKSRVTHKQVLNWHKLIIQAKDYLGANVNPKLVLENVIINV
jgi:DNA polymerase-3 subunit delta'